MATIYLLGNISMTIVVLNIAIAHISQEVDRIDRNMSPLQWREKAQQLLEARDLQRGVDVIRRCTLRRTRQVDRVLDARWIHVLKSSADCGSSGENGHGAVAY